MLNGLHEFADDRYEDTLGEECEVMTEDFDDEDVANKFYDVVGGFDMSLDYTVYYYPLEDEDDLELCLDYAYSDCRSFGEYMLKEYKKIKKLLDDKQNN